MLRAFSHPPAPPPCVTHSLYTDNESVAASLVERFSSTLLSVVREREIYYFKRLQRFEEIFVVKGSIFFCLMSSIFVIVWGKKFAFAIYCKIVYVIITNIIYYIYIYIYIYI